MTWIEVGDIDIPCSPGHHPARPGGHLATGGERIAREREPGDGSPQEMVMEQIEAALR